jgi:hypothetical protein
MSSDRGDPSVPRLTTSATVTSLSQRLSRVASLRSRRRRSDVAGKILLMADYRDTPSVDPVDDVDDPKRRLELRVARRDELAEQLDQIEAQLHADAAAARLAGMLAIEISELTGWSRNKTNYVLRDAGVAPDRSAPRKRQN